MTFVLPFLDLLAADASDFDLEYLPSP